MPRPPRKPARTSPIDAAKPVLLIVVAVVLGLLLVQQTVAFVLGQSSQAQEAMEAR